MATQQNPIPDDNTEIECMGCHKMIHHALIDGKPPEGADPETADFTVVMCQPCYGPGWTPLYTPMTA